MGMYDPLGTHLHICEKGRHVGRSKIMQLLILGVLAGCYMGFGFTLCSLGAGQLSYEFRHDQPGAFNLLFGVIGLPLGLTLCVINGASLFTSNVLYTTTAFANRRITIWQLLKVWVTAYSMNLAGALLFVQIIITAGSFSGSTGDFVRELGVKKTSYGFGQAVVKGILGNWLVCSSISFASAAQDVSGVILGIFLPISAFVTCGFEHSIANMFMLPLAYRLGADMTIENIIVDNLIPVTIGNIIGGNLVSMPYWLAYVVFGREEDFVGTIHDKKNKKIAGDDKDNKRAHDNDTSAHHDQKPATTTDLVPIEIHLPKDLSH
mmetsp:Transcript_25180/g.41433  ORF Transcript_25180/g.41433 Transcript_25180/m.41433 type:complete len:320 (+) Transcript_25180:177-1136(+)